MQPKDLPGVIAPGYGVCTEKERPEHGTVSAPITLNVLNNITESCHPSGSSFTSAISLDSQQYDTAQHRNT
jgi:hypothetical protein